MPRTAPFEKPRWLRDLLRFLPLKSQFVLSGNIHDLQACEVAPQSIAPLPLQHTLQTELISAGFSDILYWNPVKGFQQLTQNTPDLLNQLQINPQTNGPSPLLLSQVLQRLTELKGAPVALLVDYASRLLVRSDNLSNDEKQLFTQALVLSHSTRSRPYGEQHTPFFNSIIWIVEKEGDLPDWLLVNNPRLRHIPIPKPDQMLRSSLAPSLLRGLPSSASVTEAEFAQATQTLVHNTNGLLLSDLSAIIQLARVENVPLNRIADAIRHYQIGVTEDPWQRISHERIRNGQEFIQQRVKGQQHAVTHMLDIIKRAMTGVGASRKGNRPRGVAFLAGPTGVGKTELAKTITSLLFGDESAYIRFDMSEFSAEHSDQRLIGAPPGYVGYDVGGELTNAIREKPFSVVLFDEIEKAHPRILDKFLQVLDDGVLTSGRGDRVYFSEALIIFTSNLGIYSPDIHGQMQLNADPSQPYTDIQSKVRSAIEQHFKLQLNRPEILNRIGENIIVFDFIRPEIAQQIFQQMVQNTLHDLAQQQLFIEFNPSALARLEKYCLHDLAHGGRGIRNQLEAKLLNPLARALFDQQAQAGERFIIQTIQDNALELD